MRDKIVIFWFRRDLRLDDNVGLHFALQSGYKVLPIFIFDDEILDKLPKDDARVSFIYETLATINTQLKFYGSSLLVKKGSVLEVWNELCNKYQVAEVYTNRDYEPYAIKRDTSIKDFLKTKGVQFKTYKDQVIFEGFQIQKKDASPYTVFTPYKKQWLTKFDRGVDTQEYPTVVYASSYLKSNHEFPSIKTIGFISSSIKVKPYNLETLTTYHETRNFPYKDTTSYLSPYLRFGLVSIRKMVDFALQINATFLSELIWREFFMQILFHFPLVVTQNFKPKYDTLVWRNKEEEFEKWCKGETGYPLVDAGMRELNKTGYMHNRVRMVTAGFLCKHLLIDWRWGEAYFAQKLLDYDLSANNGNWQWASGTGCDAAPYFRIFNPTEQLKKFDKNLLYTLKWVDDLGELNYPLPMVEHKFARERALSFFKQAL